MKANMFTRPEIAQTMSNFVLVELYTDGTDAASDSQSTTAGIRSSKPSRFRSTRSSMPTSVSSPSSPGLTRKPTDFLAFLQTP